MINLQNFLMWLAFALAFGALALATAGLIETWGH
jgi:hypothetical protein